MSRKKEQRLRWNGSNEAQRQADEAFANAKLGKRPEAPAPIHVPVPIESDLKAKWAERGYAAYLNSFDWARKREQAFAHHGRKCSCGRKDMLVVHHLSYINLGDEPMEDLQVLCEDCHNIIHGGSKRGHGRKGRKKRRTQTKRKVI